MEEKNDLIEELDLEKLAEMALEDECANDPDPDTINVQNIIEGVAE